MSVPDDLQTTLTAEEKAALKALKNLEKVWPKSLWLFSAGGPLNVLKTDPNGRRYLLPNGGMDQEAVVGRFKIPNDGGDW